MSATTSPIHPAPRPLPGRRDRGAGIAGRLVPVVVALGPALVAVALALLANALHWRGVDQAAQAYRVRQVRDHGLALWDSGWYDGNYPLGYSVLFPIVAAVVSLPVAAATAAGGASWAFDRLVTSHLGRRPLGVWYFAASTLLAVCIGQLPYLAGEALGLAALVALTRRHRTACLVLALLGAACSPLAAAFFILACAAWWWHAHGDRRWIGVTAATTALVIVALGLLFPGTGPFPFPWGSLLVTLLACAVLATSLVRSTPVLRLAALGYAAVSAASFFIPNPVGGNASRLAAAIGVPLLVCLATAPAGAPLTTFWLRPARLDPGRWSRAWWNRPVLTVAALGALAVWQWGPGLGVVFSPATDPAVSASYYQPVLHQILARSAGPVRVEIPPTREHWEAAYVAPYVSLARGWERQLDIADNPIFYQPGTLEASTYRHWLLANGVTWVALPATPLDYAATAEGALLRTGEVRGLHLVWANRDWKLWRVTATPGLITGPATLTSLGPDDLRLDFSRPGSATVRVRSSPFWVVRAGAVCVSRDSAGWTRIDASRGGPVDLGISVLDPGVAGCRPPPA